jgi:hypothetical protein
MPRPARIPGPKWLVAEELVLSLNTVGLGRQIGQIGWEGLTQGLVAVVDHRIGRRPVERGPIRPLEILSRRTSPFTIPVLGWTRTRTSDSTVVVAAKKCAPISRPRRSPSAARPAAAAPSSDGVASTSPSIESTYSHRLYEPLR